MKSKPWEAQIPQTPKNKDRKHCYIYWRKITKYIVEGGHVVWLTDKQVTLYTIKYPTVTLEKVVDKDKKELYKKYLHQTLD